MYIQQDCNNSNKPNQWTSIAAVNQADIPKERHGHSLCSYKNKLYLFGGTPDGSSRLDDTVVFDLATNTWSTPKASGCIPPGRYRHSAVVIDGQMFVFGGYRSKCLGDLHVLNLETLVWSQPSAYGNIPTPRSSHSACAWGKKMVIFGGSGHKYSNELFVLDTETMAWQREDTTGHLPSERWCHTAAVFGNKMFVFGGTNARRQDAHVYVLDLYTFHWTRPVIDGCGPQARQLHSAAAIGQCMVVFGGWVPHSELNDMFVLNTRTLTWTRINAESLPPSRQLHACCTVAGKMVIFGGYSKNKRMNDLHIFSLEHNVSSLQDLCIDTLVTHLPRTLPHLHLIPEELLLSLFRKIGQSGKLSRDNLATILHYANHLSELSLMTCSDRVDDAWLDSIAQTESPYAEHLLKLDLSNCRKISDDGLRTLTKLPNLRVVVVDTQSEITRNGLEWLKLTLPCVTVVQMMNAGGEIMYTEFVK